MISRIAYFLIFVVVSINRHYAAAAVLNNYVPLPKLVRWSKPVFRLPSALRSAIKETVGAQIASSKYTIPIALAVTCANARNPINWVFEGVRTGFVWAQIGALSMVVKDTIAFYRGCSI